MTYRPLLFLLVPSLLQAQTIEVRIREEASGRPIVGALVRLLAANVVVAQRLSTESGRAVLRGTEPGEYMVKVDRIGWAGVTVGP